MSRINSVPVLREGPRGCGYRKAGGLYLVSGQPLAPCGKLPIALTVCPTCGEGMPYSRGWKWVDPAKLVKEGPCGATSCVSCPIAHPAYMGERAGMLWIGEKFYKSPADFMREGHEQGLSRRIKSVPRGFEVGKTWVLLAHNRGMYCKECGGSGKLGSSEHPLQSDQPCERCSGKGMAPALFSAFKPTRVEYVCRGDESDDELDAIERRGLTPVRVEKVPRQEEIAANV